MPDRNPWEFSETEMPSADLISEGKKSNQDREKEISQTLNDTNSEAYHNGKTIAGQVIGGGNLDTGKFSIDTQSVLNKYGEVAGTPAAIEALSAVVGEYDNPEYGDKFDLLAHLPKWEEADSDANFAAVGKKRLGLQTQLSLAKSTLYHLANDCFQKGDWDNGLKALTGAGMKWFGTHIPQVPEWVKQTLQEKLQTTQLYDQETDQLTDYGQALVKHSNALIRDEQLIDAWMNEKKYLDIGLKNRLNLDDAFKLTGKDRNLEKVESLSQALNAIDYSRLEPTKRMFLEMHKAQIIHNRKNASVEAGDIQTELSDKERYYVHRYFDYTGEIAKRAAASRDYHTEYVFLDDSRGQSNFEGLKRLKGAGNKTRWAELESQAQQQAGVATYDRQAKGLLATLTFVDLVNSDPQVVESLLSKNLETKEFRYASLPNGEFNDHVTPKPAARELKLENAEQHLKLNSTIAAVGILCDAVNVTNQDSRFKIFTKACEVLGPDEVDSMLAILKSIGNTSLGPDNYSEAYALLEKSLPYNSRDSISIDAEVEAALMLKQAFTGHEQMAMEFFEASNSAKANCESKCAAINETLEADRSEADKLATQIGIDLWGARVGYGEITGMNTVADGIDNNTITMESKPGQKPKLIVAEQVVKSARDTAAALATHGVIIDTEKDSFVAKLQTATSIADISQIISNCLDYGSYTAVQPNAQQEVGRIMGQISALSEVEQTLVSMNEEVFVEVPPVQPSSLKKLFGAKPNTAPSTWRIDHSRLQTLMPHRANEVELGTLSENLSELEVAGQVAELKVDPTHNPYELARQAHSVHEAVSKLKQESEAAAVLAKQINATSEARTQMLSLTRRKTYQVVDKLG